MLLLGGLLTFAGFGQSTLAGTRIARGSAYTPANPGCLACHTAIEDIHELTSINCTDCHGGDYSTDVLALAHVQPSLPPIEDARTPPLDYDLPYQQFVNPSNLRVAESVCGGCHPQDVETVIKGMMATGAGHYAGGLY